MKMTFELVRINWPNTAAILALAVMPAVSLVTLAPSRLPAAEVRAIADATNCPLPDGVALALATVATASLE
jgi:hypothetical protein